MKKLLVAGAVMLVAAGAMAQGIGGLPIGQNVGGHEEGKFTGGARATIGSFNMDWDLGVHGSYAATERLSFGAAVGFQQMKVQSVKMDSGIDFGLAGQYDFPEADTGVPMDMGVRLGYNYLQVKKSPLEADLSGISLLGIVSKKIEAVDGMSLYGGLGFWKSMGKVKVKIGGRTVGDAEADNEFLIDFGAKYKVDENWEIFGEFGYMDSFGFIFGANFGF